MKVDLPLGGKGEGLLEHADRVVPDLGRALVFTIPPVGVDEGLSNLLSRRGFATYRFGKGRPESGNTVLAHYRAALKAARIGPSDHVAVLGREEGADYIVRGWYDLYSTRAPNCAILIAPSVADSRLDNLTSPFLLAKKQDNDEIVSWLGELLRGSPRSPRAA